jgi:hypothetical protein
MDKGFWREFLVNFATLYSFVVGTVFVSYSMYRGLFPTYYYVIAVVLYLGYFLSWAIDKKRYFNETGS